MRFFEGDGKYNWVDENNILLGYSSSQDCCEWASWFVSAERHEGPPTDDDGFAKREEDLPQELDWENWVFEQTFFYTNTESSALEDGGIAVFRLRHKKAFDRKMYLHIFNCHNGYYSHGFVFEGRHENPKIQAYL